MKPSPAAIEAATKAFLAVPEMPTTIWRERGMPELVRAAVEAAYAADEGLAALEAENVSLRQHVELLQRNNREAMPAWEKLEAENARLRRCAIDNGMQYEAALLELRRERDAASQLHEESDALRARVTALEEELDKEKGMRREDLEDEHKQWERAEALQDRITALEAALAQALAHQAEEKRAALLYQDRAEALQAACWLTPEESAAFLTAIRAVALAALRGETKA